MSTTPAYLSQLVRSLSSSHQIGYYGPTWKSVYSKADAANVMQASDTVTLSPVVSIVTVLPSTTTVPTTFNGAKVDFRLTKGIVPNIKTLWMKWNISNSSGAQTVTVVPAPYLCSRIEFLVNGGSLLAQTLYPETMNHRFAALLSTEDQTRIAQTANLGIGASYGQSLAAIAISSTVQYYWPLLGNFFEYLPGDGFDMNHHSSDIVIRFWLQNGTAASQTAGTGTVVLNSLQLVVESIVKPDKDNYHPDSGMIRIPCLDVVNQSQTIALTAGTSLPIKLNALNGLYPYLLLGVRATPVVATANAYPLFITLGDGAAGATLDLLDQNQQSLQGNTPIDPTFLLTQIVPKRFPGLIPSTIFLYPIIAYNPAVAEARAILNGTWNFTTNELLRILPSTAFATGTYQVDIWGKRLTWVVFNWRTGIFTVSYPAYNN